MEPLGQVVVPNAFCSSQVTSASGLLATSSLFVYGVGPLGICSCITLPVAKIGQFRELSYQWGVPS